MPVTARGEASPRMPATPTPHELKGTACAGTGEPAGRVEAGCPLGAAHLLCEGSAPPPPPPRALNRGTPHPRMALPPPRGQTTPLTALGTLQNPAEGTRTRSPRWVSALGAGETLAGDADPVPTVGVGPGSSRDAGGGTRPGELWP